MQRWMILAAVNVVIEIESREMWKKNNILCAVSRFLYLNLGGSVFAGTLFGRKVKRIIVLAKLMLLFPYYLNVCILNSI